MTASRYLWAPLVARPARRDRGRYALTVTGIAVGVATVAAIRLANASVLSSFSKTVDAVAGKATLTVLADGAGIPDETLERLAWLRAEGVALAPAVLETAATGAFDGDVVEVLGVDPLADAAARDYVAASGASGGARAADGFARRALASAFERDAVFVTEAFAARRGLKAGDALPLVANGREIRMRVAALLSPVGPARAAGGSLVVADLATAQEAFGKVGRLDRIDVVLPEGTPPEGVARFEEEIRASLPPSVTVGRPERRTETVDRMVRAFRVNLNALGLIALLVGVSFVYNTLSISVLRRRADIGVVRALGASRRSVFAVFLAEGALLGAAGGALGVGLGILLARAALVAVGGTATELYLPSAHPELGFDAGVLLSSFAVGVLASTLSALAPAMEAARVAPAAGVRHGSVEAARRRATKPLALSGALLLALGALATRPGPVSGLPLFGFAAVFCVVAGTSLLAPAAVTLAARLFDRAALRLFGVEARIARANLTGSLSRTSVAVAALAMGISMMVSVAVMVGSFRDTVITWVHQTLASDLFVAPATGRAHVSFGRMPEEAIAAVRAVPGVAAVDPFLAFTATKDGVPFTVGSGDFRYVAERGRLPLVDGRDVAVVAAAARARGEALVSEPYAEKFGVSPGDVVTLPARDGPARVRVAAVYVDYSNDRGSVMLDREQFKRLFGIEGAVSLALSLAPGLSAEEGARRVRRAVRGRFAVKVRTNAVLRREAIRVFDRTFAVTYALEVVAVAVAVLGVFNTLVALVLERRREIGLLRVLGASAGRVARAVRLEAAGLALLGTVLGLAAGGAMSFVLIHVVNRQSFGWTIGTSVPWGFLSAAVALVLVATLLASIGPARLAAGTDAAAALKEE